MYAEAKELLSAGWLMEQEGEKYIWLSDSPSENKGARFLFAYMLHRQIYIDGFVTDTPSLVGLRMYHKKIVDISALDQSKSIILYDPFIGRYQKSDIADIGIYARDIHPEIDRENVIIWGAGATGEWAWKILTGSGVHVLYFVDSDEKLAGTRKCGLPVYTPDKIQGNVTIVEAMESWKQLDEEIWEKYGKRFYFSFQKPSMRFECNINGADRKIFDLNDFWNFNFLEDKRVYIFGDGEIEQQFAKNLLLLDYDFAGFLVEEMDSRDKEEGSKYPVKYVEEILYESNFCIWIYGKEKAYKLEKLGLRQYIDYMCHVEYVGISRGRKDCLDINLGHSYRLDKAKYPGIVVYGDERAENYKIAVLGGSTSDGAMYPFQAWPELLYGELNCDDVTIYNCGVCGYTSGQELFRLVRDVLPLQPDMILVFDGFNDIWCKPEYPFRFQYVEQVFDYAKNYIEDPYTGEIYDDVCFGVESQSDRAGNWLSNLRSMYAIAADRDIKFYCFCQPVLASKEGKTIKEKNMLISMPFTALSRESSEAFRKVIGQMREKPTYLYDLSHIFDNRENIYMDYVHVWEEGNRIIAKEIEKIISPAIGKKAHILEHDRE